MKIQLNEKSCHVLGGNSLANPEPASALALHFQLIQKKLNDLQPDI
ncbi:hypothetical protein P9B45_06970 [Bacillus paralicheniformis]|nr:hypothetical protein [Bacillus paralicheniformis]MEC1281081.1 hypothetical protein [Bacillus paralicheniformis]